MLDDLGMLCGKVGLFAGIVDDVEQLDAVVDDFGNAATAAVEAGFDAIEIHMGHGYLLSSFFSPNLNKRSDRYGGTTARRAELEQLAARASEGIDDLQPFKAREFVDALFEPGAGAVKAGAEARR